MGNFERITYVDKRLREGHRLTVEEVAERFEVSGRQVKRDLEYLRDRLAAPVEWVRDGRYYRYGKKFDGLAFADEKLLSVYALLRSMLASDYYLPLAKSEPLSDVEAKMSRDYREVADRVSYELPVQEHIDMGVFGVVAQAMLAGKLLDVKYRNARGERSERSLEAEHLINYSGRWYLVAHDSLRDGLRTFHLSRIEGATLSKAKATHRRSAARKAEVAAYLSSGFGIFKGGSSKTAVIRVRGQAAELVERQIWHPKQKMERVDRDGVACVELSLPVSDWTELVGRVLSYGAAAEALSPPEFRDRWKAEVKAMAALAKGG